MGVYAATNEIASVLTDNLATELATVGTAASVSLVTGFTLVTRARAETAWKRDRAVVAVWMGTAATRAKSQTRRRWKISLNIDYTFQGQDREEVAAQVELALEALMRCLDLVPEEAATLSGAGEEEYGSVAVTDLDELLAAAAGDVTPSGPILGGVRLTVPIVAHDNL